MMTPKKRPFWRSPLFWSEALTAAAMFVAIFGAMTIGKFLW